MTCPDCGLDEGTMQKTIADPANPSRDITVTACAYCGAVLSHD